MSSSYLQLIAKGAQDKYLTVNPQISFFKSVYRRYTNFGQTSVEVPMMGDTSFGGLCRAILPRRGDLINDIYISIELPAVTCTSGSNPSVRWVQKLGHAMIEYIEIVIGNEVIDRHTGEWLELYSQLFMTDEKKKLYNNMIGQKGSLINDQPELHPQYLYIPLQFWFCKDSGISLPICSLQVHDVEIRIKTRLVDQLLITDLADTAYDAGRLENISLFCNYIWLDAAERKKFANTDHTYLIETIQLCEASDIGGARGNSVPLFFNHPVKELVFCGSRNACLSSTFSLNADGFPDYNAIFNFGSSCTPGENLNMFESFLLQLNGSDFIQREANYFNIYVPWKLHTNAPDVGVFCHSFALKPEQYQPSGTVNFSRLDSANLKVEFNEEASFPILMRVYARTYNVLIFNAQGQAALEFQQ